jgi:hypothetical protein
MRTLQLLIEPSAVSELINSYTSEDDSYRELTDLETGLIKLPATVLSSAVEFLRPLILGKNINDVPDIGFGIWEDSYDSLAIHENVAAILATTIGDSAGVIDNCTVTSLVFKHKFLLGVTYGPEDTYQEP